MTTAWALALGLALLLANGFFVAAEFALLASRRARIEQLVDEGSRGASHALAGLRELTLMLAGAQLGITMCSLALGAVAEPALHRGLDALLAETAVPRPVTAVASLVIALGVTIFLHMVVGEMAPKSWAISHPERSALLLALPFRWFVRVLRPFIRLLNWLSNRVVRAVGVEPQDELAQAHAPRELVLLLEESAQQGSIDTAEQRLLTRAIDLSGLDAEAAMIPRRDVVAVPVDADLPTIERTAASTGRSRLPVYDGDLDHVVGALHVMDVLAVEGERRGAINAGQLAQPTMLVPESRPLEDLMLEMRSRRQHIAMVVDEHGSVAGLVALEDVLEELIGEFEDESDRRRRGRQAVDGAGLLDASLRPDEFAQETGLRLPDGEWETVGGFVMAALGRVPAIGDRVVVDGHGIEVVRMDGHRVVEVAVRPLGADG